jgi:hypothetical protein
MAAFFFAFHPLRVETVVWATERRGLLSAFFCLLAALRHLDGDRRRPAFFLLLGILSKESAMAWPVALLFLDVWVLRRSTTPAWLRENVLLVMVALFGAAAGAFATQHAQVPTSWEEHGPLARIVQVARAPAFYLWKTLWPSGLSPLYELPTNAGGIPWDRRGAAAVGAAMTIAAALLHRRRPALFGSWMIFVALLLPTAGLFQSGPQEVADRYTYLAALPWAFWAGAAARRRAAWATPLLMLLAGLSLYQQSFWRTPVALWRRAAEVSPESDYAQYNLGTSLLAAGRMDEAEAAFRKTLVLNPTMERALFNLGVLSHRSGQAKAAEDFYRRALWVEPSDAVAHNNLGRLLMDEGRFQEARVELESAARLMPDSPVVRKNLEALESRAGRPRP